MIDIIRGCQRIVRELRSQIARLRAERIGRDDIRDSVRATVDGYFRTDRPILRAEVGDAALLSEVDALMQELLRLAQGRSRRSRYLQVLGHLDQAWREVEVKALPLAQPLIGQPTLSESHEAIARTLERICESAASCYRQAIYDLGDSHRHSWRGTASELREALRELLDKLAPDAEVVESQGFRYEEGLRAPTMKQKVRFILRSRRRSESERRQMEDAAEVVDEKVGSFVRSVYTRSSSSVHAEPSKKDVQSLLRFVDTCFAELLELE